MTQDDAMAMAQPVFDRLSDGDASGARDAAERYLEVFGSSSDPDITGLTSDMVALHLETTATLFPDEAPAECDEVVSRYRAHREPTLRYVAAWALRIKVGVLMNLRRDAEAVRAGEEFTVLSRDLGDAARQIEIAEQMVEVAYMLMSRSQHAVAEPLLRLVEERLSSDQSEAARSVLARARLQLVVSLIALGDPEPLLPQIHDLHAMGEDGLTAISQLIERWAGNPYWEAATVVALTNRLAILALLGREQELQQAQADFRADVTGLGSIPGLDALVESIQSDRPDKT